MGALGVNSIALVLFILRRFSGFLLARYYVIISLYVKYKKNVKKNILSYITAEHGSPLSVALFHHSMEFEDFTHFPKTVTYLPRRASFNMMFSFKAIVTEHSRVRNLKIKIIGT